MYQTGVSGRRPATLFTTSSMHAAMRAARRGAAHSFFLESDCRCART